MLSPHAHQTISQPKLAYLNYRIGTKPQKNIIFFKGHGELSSSLSKYREIPTLVAEAENMDTSQAILSKLTIIIGILN